MENVFVSQIIGIGKSDSSKHAKKRKKKTTTKNRARIFKYALIDIDCVVIRY